MWFDDEQDEYNQKEFSIESGVSDETIYTARTNVDWIPSANVMRKIMRVVKELDPEMRASDFWDI